MLLKIKKPNLTEYQEKFLYNDERFTIVEASTKVGKTFSMIWWIFEQAHKKENKNNYNYWWISPSYSQSKIAFNRLRVKIAKTGLYKINESNLIITTPKGVNIHFKSAEKPDNLYGEDVYGVVFDEAPRARVEAFHALRSTVTYTKAKIKLIGNFGGTANWMHQLKQLAETDSQYSYHKITAWDAVEAGILDEEEILQAQRDLPPKVFKQLYLAEEQEADDMLCTYDAINDLFTNEHMKEHGDKYMSCDIAMMGSDKFVIIVWHGFVIIDMIMIDKIEANEIVEKIKQLANKHGVGQSNIVYDADGLGQYLRGYLSNAKAFHNNDKATKNQNYKNIKNQCYYKLAEKINNREIFVKFATDKKEIIKELECLRSYALDDDGKIQAMPKKKIKEVIGRSPDILDALAMRMYYEVKTVKWSYI